MTELNDKYYEEEFDELVNYCKRLGWKVTQGHKLDDAAIFDTKEITINSQRKPEIKLYRLLHEIGHVLFSKTKDYEFRATSAYCETTDRRRNTDRVETLEEEFAAWARGFILAEKRGIFIDKEQFDRDKAACIMTYMRWAVKPKEWYDD